MRFICHGLSHWLPLTFPRVGCSLPPGPSSSALKISFLPAKFFRRPVHAPPSCYLTQTSPLTRFAIHSCHWFWLFVPVDPFVLPRCFFCPKRFSLPVPRVHCTVPLLSRLCDLPPLHPFATLYNPWLIFFIVHLVVTPLASFSSQTLRCP